MKTLGETIKEVIQNLLTDRFKVRVIVPVPEIPKNLEYGELFTDVAFKLASSLKTSPNVLAEELSCELKDFGAQAVNGFINFKIPVSKSIRFVNLNELDFLRGKKVLCEFVSANPTGPLHIGHGRIAAVGGAISKILKFCGAEVVNEFYINDAGEQIEKLGLALIGKSEEYKGKYTESLRERIKFDPNQDPASIGFAASQIIIEDIRKTLKNFRLNFDSWVSEREIASKYSKKALELLKDYIYREGDAYFLRTTLFGDDKDRVIVKSDGKPTYFGNDCAYHLYKVERNFDELVQVWGADHHGYINRIMAALKIFGFKNKFVVKLVQMVNLIRDGKPVQMSKREGTFITLQELIDEVGVDSAKFIYLTRTADSHLDFDVDLAKKKNMENPVYYVQYAHARTSSLFREARSKGFYDGYNEWKYDMGRFIFEEKERRLLALSAVLYDVIYTSAKMYEPAVITSFLMSLAKEFHSYYQSQRILVQEKDVRFSRLYTCEVVQRAIRICLDILGVEAPEKM